MQKKNLVHSFFDAFFCKTNLAQNTNSQRKANALAYQAMIWEVPLIYLSPLRADQELLS